MTQNTTWLMKICDEDTADEFLHGISDFSEGCEAGEEVYALISAAKRLSHFVGRDGGCNKGKDEHDTTGKLCLKLIAQATGIIVELLCSDNYLVDENVSTVGFLRNFDEGILPSGVYSYVDSIKAAEASNDSAIADFQEKLSQAIRTKDEPLLKALLKDAQKLIRGAE